VLLLGLLVFVCWRVRAKASACGPPGPAPRAVSNVQAKGIDVEAVLDENVHVRVGRLGGKYTDPTDPTSFLVKETESTAFSHSTDSQLEFVETANAEDGGAESSERATLRMQPRLLASRPPSCRNLFAQLRPTGVSPASLS
jgi:hypothetical protein